MGLPRSAPRRAFAFLFALILVVGQVASAAAATSSRAAPGGVAASAARVDGDLLKALAAGTADRFVVEFAAKADLRGAPKIKDHGKRGQFVLDALTATATKAQAAAHAQAKKLGVKATTYWLADVMIVRGNDKVAAAMAKVPGVTAIRAMKTYPVVKPVETKAAILAAVGDPEWGVEKIRADQAWNAGIIGQGVVVSSVDTGVDYTHPALIEQYRGNVGGTFVNDYNWWDPTGICGNQPCDNAGHGTHTMGTMVGGDGPGPFTPDVGVAPGAKWIAAKGCEDFFCTEESLLSAGQFILAPTKLDGSDPDPSKRPDIVNNSWGSGPNDPFYLATVQAWRAAGIIPVFSSGNPGPFCGEGGSPGDFLESFSVGATDIDDNIAEFSGRGPSVFGKVNPDVSAPGVDVVSSVPGGGYESFSGTSMAAPHTSGAIALILSAEPGLIGDPNNFVVATDAIRTTAVDRIDNSCGGAEDGDPNNVYGDGRIDAKAAVDLVATGGTIVGTVTDTNGAAPIGGATVTASGGFRDFSVVTDSAGHYEMFLAEGTYTLTVSAFGYGPAGIPGVTIVTDQETTQDVRLTALPRFDISGVVRAAEDGSVIAGASVKALGTPVPAAISNAGGAYTLTLPIGTYTIRGSAGGCTEVHVHDGVVLADANITLDFTLGRKIDGFGHGCRPIAFDWVDAPIESALYGNDFAGRLRLPFDFGFYGATYQQVFISDNGYLNFLGADLQNDQPVSIPSTGAPNAAIYAFWKDLYLDAGSTISYGTSGPAGSRIFVLEYNDVRVRGALAPIDFEIKLHEGGETVDLLFGDNPANPGDGRGATIGIENATGTDALEFSFSEALLGPTAAYRFEIVPVATVHGTVTDANDGQPIAGAAVKASPGLVATTTAADGTYRLHVYPGAYQIEISRSGYVSETTSHTLAAGDDLVLDAALDAGIPAVAPTTIEVSAEFGAAPVVREVVLSNNGLAGYTWEAKERSRGSTPVIIPTGTAGKGARAGSKDVSSEPSRSITPTRAGTHVTGQPVLLLMDFLPWDSDAIQQVLAANAVEYDLADSSQMATIDFAAYRFVIIANDQTDEFYDRYDASASRFADYVAGGGFLWVGAASSGFNGGSFSGSALPGGVTIGGDVFEDFNDVAAPSHELMAGVPNPFFGSYASHTVFANLPADGTVIARGSSTGDPTLVEYDFGGGHVVAFAQPFEYAFANGEDGARILENAVPYAVNYFTDVPWLAESPASGSLAAGGDATIALTIGDPHLGPGEHRAQVVFVASTPKPHFVTVDVTLTVALPATWGGLSGTITDAHSGEPLAGAGVTLHSQWNGQPLDASATSGGDGRWSLIGPAGTWPLEIARAGYVGVTRNEAVTAGTTRTGIDAALHQARPHGATDGGDFTFILTQGRHGHGTVTLANPEGHLDLTFEIGEVNLGGGPAAASTGSRTLPALADPNARTTKGSGRAAVAVPPSITAVGDVLASWPTVGMALPWGVGYDGTVWLSDPENTKNHQFSTAGEPSGVSWSTSFGEWAGDMAYDKGRNLLWQVAVGGDNGIYGLDPADGSIEQTITGSPWGAISQRGLAYDPAEDVFYIGGWNEGIVYKVAGPSHPTPGETLHTCNPPDPNISGLAWNGSFGMLWEATNSESDTIYLLDPVTCEASVAIPHPSGGGGNGAGLELDAVGNLWTVSQGAGEAFLIESGLPTFSDVPWLTVEPASGSVAPDGTQDLDIHVDATGLEPGVYRAIVVVQTNDPDLRSVQVPVTLVVPAYQQGVNAGGGAYVNANGDLYGVDRAWSAGSFGWLGASSTRSTGSAIAGTTEDPIYQDLRSGMTGYRFDVPDGQYRVDLSFAELVAKRAGARVFSVTIEGTTVLAGLDVFAVAGGRFIAVDRSFVVNVSDGQLDIGFTPQRGDVPIVNGILVTEMPPGS
jgi:subtilisin family serine protease